MDIIKDIVYSSGISIPNSHFQKEQIKHLILKKDHKGIEKIISDFPEKLLNDKISGIVSSLSFEKDKYAILLSAKILKEDSHYTYPILLAATQLDDELFEAFFKNLTINLNVKDSLNQTLLDIFFTTNNLSYFARTLNAGILNYEDSTIHVHDDISFYLKFPIVGKINKRINKLLNFEPDLYQNFSLCTNYHYQFFQEEANSIAELVELKNKEKKDSNDVNHISMEMINHYANTIGKDLWLSSIEMLILLAQNNDTIATWLIEKNYFTNIYEKTEKNVLNETKQLCTFIKNYIDTKKPLDIIKDHLAEKHFLKNDKSNKVHIEKMN
jgi:hypothetical protein